MRRIQIQLLLSKIPQRQLFIENLREKYENLKDYAFQYHIMSNEEKCSQKESAADLTSAALILLMIFSSLDYSRAAVDRFVQYYAHKLVGEGELGKGKTKLAGGFYAFRKPV